MLIQQQKYSSTTNIRQRHIFSNKKYQFNKDTCLTRRNMYSSFNTWLILAFPCIRIVWIWLHTTIYTHHLDTCIYSTSFIILTQSHTKNITSEQYIYWYPENSPARNIFLPTTHIHQKRILTNCKRSTTRNINSLGANINQWQKTATKQINLLTSNFYQGHTISEKYNGEYSSRHTYPDPSLFFKNQGRSSIQINNFFITGNISSKCCFLSLF